MAGNYAVVDQPRRTVKVVSANESIDVQQVDFVTLPSGVRATAYVPWPQWLAQGADTTLEPLATAIEDAISGGLADGGWGYEDTDAQGLIVSGVTFVVSYTDPSTGVVSSTTVDVPYDVLLADTQFGGFLTGGSADDRLRQAYDALVATAKL